MGILIAAGLVSLACVLHLWLRRPGSALRKLVWSIVAAVPGLGPLLYLGMYEAPAIHGDNRRAFRASRYGIGGFGLGSSSDFGGGFGSGDGFGGFGGGGFGGGGAGADF